MVVIGLTGGIGMGKSTVARMFEELGAKMYDADAIVHRLWENHPALLEWVRSHYPSAVSPDGKVDRKALAAEAFASPRSRKELEDMVHPLVQEEEAKFIEEAKASGARVVVLEIPLLFETEGEERMDLTIAVSAPPEVQHARVFSRPRMDEVTYQRIIDRQLDDDTRCAKADLVIPTSCEESETRAIVKAMWDQLQLELDQLEGKQQHA